MAFQHHRLLGESSLTGLQMPAFSLRAHMAERGAREREEENQRERERVKEKEREMERENLSSGLFLL